MCTTIQPVFAILDPLKENMVQMAAEEPRDPTACQEREAGKFRQSVTITSCDNFAFPQSRPEPSLPLTVLLNPLR